MEAGLRLAAIMAGVLLAMAANRASAQDAPAASEAQRLLKGASDPADFTDVSAGGLISLKHKPSGLVCAFSANPEDNSLRASPAGVICSTQSASEIDTLEAFHASASSDDEVQGAVGRAMGQFGDGARPVSGFTDAKSDRPNVPAHVSRRFVATTRDGQQLFLRIAYSQVGDWFVLQRVIAAPGTAQLADADAERRLLAAIGQAMDRKAEGGGP
jgi:hypothetical protein